MGPENFDGKGNFDVVLCHQYFVNTIYLKFSSLILFIISHSPYFKNRRTEWENITGDHDSYNISCDDTNNLLSVATVVRAPYQLILPTTYSW